MTSHYLARVFLVVGFIVILSLGLASQLAHLLYDRQFLKKEGDARAVRKERINAHRGVIQDRLGKPLAVSTPMLSLWANPKEIKRGKNYQPIAKYLGTRQSRFLAQMAKRNDRGFVYLRRHRPASEVERLMALKLPGIYEQREFQRFYPAGEVASHVIGFTGVEDQGQEGLELAYDDYLAGIPGRQRVVQDRHGRNIRGLVPEQEAEPGGNLELTIDSRLQYLAYRELKSAVTNAKAKGGSCVLVDVTSGQILALVNQPSYNPNNRADLNMAGIRNRALTDLAEPGSTIKPFTVAAALMSGHYTPSSRIDTSPGLFKVGNFVVRDPRDRGVLTLQEVLAYSSQVGIAKVAVQLDGHKTRALFNQLGFGQGTALNFPGESAGYLPSHPHWQAIDRATLGYGYGLSVTPVQLAGAYVAIASGGLKRELSLLLAADTRTRRVMPEEVAQQVKAMLAMAVNAGTGAKAAVAGYPVAGKTGTVRKVGKKGYRDTEHLAFFAGFAPVDKPRLVGVILIDEPRSGVYGGAIAAPVFARIISAALRILNVPPQQSESV